MSGFRPAGGWLGDKSPFHQEGGGPGGTGYPSVDSFAELPAAADHSGEIYAVLNTTGVWLFGQKKKGLYQSNGAEWSYFSSFPGIAQWDSGKTYVVNELCFSDDGGLYDSLTSGNTGNDPELTSNWKKIAGVIMPEQQMEVLPTNPSHSEGLVFYDGGKNALSYYNDISDITVNIGQEVLFRIQNLTGSTIPNGTVLFPSPTTIVGLADSKYKDRSRVIGVTTHEILNNEYGFIAKLGQVGDLDTSMYSEGDILYLAEDGNYTNVQPIGEYYVCIVGVVDVVSATEGIITVDTSTTDLTVEVTDTNGFPTDQRDITTLLALDSSRLFSVIADDTEFHFYENGDKYRSTGDAITWTDVEGEHWFYYDMGVLTHKANPTQQEKELVILNNAFVAYIYWNATDKVSVFDVFDERHGISISPYSHLYLHLTRGAQYLSGLSLGDVIADGTGNNDTDAQFSITEGAFFDEDILHETNSKIVGDTWQVGYLEGANNFRTSTQTNFALLNASAGRPYYNQNIGGVWQLTEVTNGDYFLIHIFAINGDNDQTISIVGQNIYPTVGSARAGATTEISNINAGFELAESIPIATVIYQTRDNYSNAVKSRIRTTDEGEDFVDWRQTELSQGTAPSSHNNLTNLQLAGSGVTWGHVSSTEPLALPQFTTTEMNALTASVGMFIYNTTENKPYYYNGSLWVSL